MDPEIEQANKLEHPEKQLSPIVWLFPEIETVCKFEQF
jgi:hypothetical protein